jgi:hypothetical protein
MGYGMVWRHRSTWETDIFKVGEGADFGNTLRFFGVFVGTAPPPPPPPPQTL